MPPDETKIPQEIFESDLRYLLAISHIVLANNQVTSRYIERTYDMPVYAWSTLYAVVKFPGVLAKDIQRLFPRPQNSVSRAVALLKARDWIRDEPSEQDTRAKHLFPTEAGTKVLRQIERKIQQRQSEIFGALSLAERDVFLDLCRKIILNGELSVSKALQAES